ncbi:hypothetical protein EX30DRAFT_164464 [Ascodesmis nigricans]|uniref:Uncharacterized protein n=1 Tax=Ascodesmis nigricans TaxID=341454 RepID=A0A4S2MM68_9PEZI|nr:hypothetical protein EX30DRAFT_164464 [Ascodesmis nigricans]
MGVKSATQQPRNLHRHPHPHPHPQHPPSKFSSPGPLQSHPQSPITDFDRSPHLLNRHLISLLSPVSLSGLSGGFLAFLHIAVPDHLDCRRKAETIIHILPHRCIIIIGKSFSPYRYKLYGCI